MKFNVKRYFVQRTSYGFLYIISIAITYKKMRHIHREKWFEKLHSAFQQSWDIWISWTLFNIIVIICDVQNVKKCMTVLETLKIYSKVFNIK